MQAKLTLHAPHPPRIKATPSNLLDNFRATVTESGEEIDVDSEEEQQPTLLEGAPNSSGAAIPRR